MLPLPKGAVWQLLFLFCAGLYITGVRSEGRVVCYYTNWSVYRPGTAKFNPQNINPYLCTHLIYAFGGFTKDNQMKPFDKYQDIEQGGYAKFTGLKTYNKQLKTMIAIGGWNEASSRFSPLVANAERRQKFIKNILKFLRQNHFDGIDLDWEYPAHREGGKPRDRDNYAQFVQELRAEFERESEKTGRPRLLLTMAVPAGIEYIEKGYDIPKLNKYLDWFNVLTYDFHSSHEPSVNHHAPLYSLEEESEYNYDSELNIDYSIKFYLNAGADRDKLVLGIPTYGRSYTLINEDSTEIGAPAEAPGDQGDATREKGYLAYYEICQNIKEDPEWTVVQPNPNAMGPYAYRRNQWVGYDDEAIVRKKAQYVVDNGLGGIMFWAIDNDDFRGLCTGKAYPLIEAAKDAMLDALGLGINEVSKPAAPQKPSRSRSRENSSSTRNRITTTEHKLTYAERKGSSKRLQTTQQETTRNRQQSTTTAAPTSIKLTEAEGSSLYIGGRTTTPPPPTTPDPGTDFKCEDEGFFQHPRDCKKYYWCLDSGPSGLGIVAHQFTCPSGLYFNPAADSCDFARNVPCKVKKSTTAAPITSPATTTTTARPTSSYNRLPAATARSTTYFRTTPRTTTTTEAAEEDEYEEEEDENPSSLFAKPKGFDKDSEEDPKVIKELIELIRKVGGIDELEKHLLRKDDGTISIKENSSSSSSSLTPTTPSSISKSLYEKVLSKPNALNSFRNRFTSSSSFRTTKTQTKTQEATEEDEEESHELDSKSSGASAGFSKYSSVLRGNSRQGPQSEGLDKLSEFDGFLKEKKQYITINRNRDNKQSQADDEVDEVSYKFNLKDNEDDEEAVEANVKSTRKPLLSSTLSYSTIRRTRPSTTTEANQEEAQEEEEEEVKGVAERKSYAFNRNRNKGLTTTELPEVTEATAGSTRYRYLERSRPTRPTTESYNKAIDNQDNGDANESENQENTVHFKAVNIENTRETQKEITTNTQRTYASIGRRTTASTAATPETDTSPTAAKTITTTTISLPTTSTKETPLTTPLTVIETITSESILTTHIPISTTTNPSIRTTTASPHGEDLSKILATTPNPNDINSDISETQPTKSTQHINSPLIDSFLSKSIPLSTTESSLYRNEQENDSQLTTTETTISSTTATITDSDNLTKTDDLEEEEVNLVSKQRNKTLYNTRTRTTTTTSPKTTTTTTNVEIETTPSPTITTNAKKPFGVRRQQILLNRSSQTKITSAVTTTDIPITSTTETINNDFLGTVSSPRPFGFPKRRNRPTGTAAITSTSVTTEEISKSNDEILNTKQKTTKLNAAANSQTKVSSHNTILSQTTTETSSQQEHAPQTESEVASNEHLNSKDTKVEQIEKHVVEQVDGIDFINDNLRHDIDNVDSNNNSALKTTTHTFVHKAGNETDKVVVNQVTNEQTVRQKVSQNNFVGVNEKDLRFNKKQNDFVENSGKYRGKSLENSLESSTLGQNHTDGQNEGRNFKTYTTTSGEQISSFTEMPIVKFSEETEEEKSTKSEYNYSEINRGTTAITKTKSTANNTSQESVKNSYNTNYSTITRGSSSNDENNSQHNINEEQIDDDLTTTTTSNQDAPTNSNLVEEKVVSGTIEIKSQGELKTKLKYSSLNRNFSTASHSQTAKGELRNGITDENESDTTKNYSKLTEGTQIAGKHQDIANYESADHKSVTSDIETKSSHVNNAELKNKFEYATLDRSTTPITESPSRKEKSKLTTNSQSVDHNTDTATIETKTTKSFYSQSVGEGQRTTNSESIENQIVTSAIETSSRESNAELENKRKYTSLNRGFTTASYSEFKKDNWEGATNSSELIANKSDINNTETKSLKETDSMSNDDSYYTSLNRDSTTSIYSQSTEDVLENIKTSENQRTALNYTKTTETLVSQRVGEEDRTDHSESIEDKTTLNSIETKSSQDSEAKTQNKFNYISLNRNRNLTTANSSQSAQDELQNNKTDENQRNTILTYTKTTTALESQTVGGDQGSADSETIANNTELETKFNHNTLNRGSTTLIDSQSEKEKFKVESNSESVNTKTGTSRDETKISSESKAKIKNQFNDFNRSSTTATNYQSKSHDVERTTSSDSVDDKLKVDIEIKSSQENEAELKNKHKYSSFNRSSTTTSGVQTQEDNKQRYKTGKNQSKTSQSSETVEYEENRNNSQSVQDTATKHQYTENNAKEANGTNLNKSSQEITRGQLKHEDDNENSDDKNKIYATLNRKRTSEIQTETENYTENGSHYTTTKSETGKKTYTSIARNRGSASSTENIPYKAIVRDSEGVHLNEEQFSGFIKQNENSDAIETSKITYQSISRGGQVLQSETDVRRTTNHSKTDTVKVPSVSPIERKSEKQHAEDENTTEGLTTATKPITITEKSSIRNTNAKTITTISLSTAENTTASEQELSKFSDEVTTETVTTTPAATSTKSLFKNRHTTDAISGESETEIRSQTQANQTSTQITNSTGRRRVILRKRPIPVRKTNINKEENKHDLQGVTESSGTSFRTINKSSLSKVREDQFKVSDNSNQEGRYTSNRRREKLENQEDTYNRTETSEFLSKEEGNNSDTINNANAVSSTKKTIFSGNNSQYGTVNSSGIAKTSKLNTKAVGNVDYESLDEPENREKIQQGLLKFFNHGKQRPALRTSTEAEREDQQDNNQIASSVTETLNASRRTGIRKRIQSFNESSLRSQSTESSANHENNSEKLEQQNNSEIGRDSESTFTYRKFNRKNAFANKRVTSSQSAKISDNNKSRKHQEIENTKTTEEVENSIPKSFNIQNKENTPKPDSYSRRRPHNTHLKNKSEKTEEVEILEDGSKRIKTIYIETINIGGNKVKTIKTTKIKTIIKQAVEYEDDGEETVYTTTTRRPVLSNRGAARFESNDLSSLLALDFASKSSRHPEGGRSSFKSRRKVIRKPPIIKEEEFVEEFEEELPASSENRGGATETPQLVKSRIRPTKPFSAVFTTTTKAPKFDKNETGTPRNSSVTKPHSATEGTTLVPSNTKDNEQKVESATRRSFALERNFGSTKTVTTTEKTSEGGTTTKRAFDFKRPFGTRLPNRITTTERISDTTLSQITTGKEEDSALKNNNSTTTTHEEISKSAIESVTIFTESSESTTEENSRTTTTDSQDSLDLVKNRLANAVQSLKTKAEKVAKAEIADAIEMKNEITAAISNGEDLTQPIYHRHKYFQYFKDSPITYISPSAATVETNIKTNADIKKQIHEVFDVSKDYIKPETELSDEAIAAMALEQAHEINAELSHFLLKTPRSK